MTFASPYFWIFLISTFCFYHMAPSGWRWMILLGASYLFYWWQAPILVLVLLLITVVSYFGGLGIARSATERQAALQFWLTTLLCLGILGILKYGSGMVPLPLALQTIVAVGVSYYIFQAVSYLADIRLGLVEPERNIGYYALYVAFFPKLLQGPIERADALLPQIRNLPCFDYQLARSGLLLFGWGLFQKVVVADRLGLYVDAIYNDLHKHQGISLLLATYGYAGQIYFDFAGYTTMALGAARLFGISLSPNFNRPYLATSIADFWRRWHISFSRWILDYIFKPLQLSWRNYGSPGVMAALLSTFFVSGLWHGASWGFIIWGGLHGCYMACSVIYRPWQKKLYQQLGITGTSFASVWQILVTFHLVCLAWVFFRANSITDALYLLQHLWPLHPEGMKPFMLLQGTREGCITATLIAGLCGVALSPPLKSWFEKVYTGSWRWLWYYLLLMTILVFGIFHQRAFLYGRF
jgi:D-alanyl-lipoteichoic acid acyltransferase DltB (MBOAT superfamily)